MKKFNWTLFTLFLSCIPFLCVAKEIVVTTKEGESFLMQIDSQTTLDELAQKIDGLAQEKENTMVLIEMPLRGEEISQPIAWGRKAKTQHGKYLGYPRDYEAELTADQRDALRYIITFLANKPLLTIAGHKGILEEKGNHIDKVHPLRFLLTVFTDEELKVGIRNIRAKNWVWGDFISGLKESLSTEASIYNIDAHLWHFSQAIELDPALITPAVYSRRWDEFIDLLITYVPRKGDFNRFDS